MKQFIFFKATHKETAWVLSLTNNANKNRIRSNMIAIDRVYSDAKSGNLDAMLTLFKWHRECQSILGVIEPESKRLKRLIKAKLKNLAGGLSVENGFAYRFPVNNRLHAQVFQVIRGFDEIMSLLETCLNLGVFTNRQLVFRKRLYFKKRLLKLMAKLIYRIPSEVRNLTSFSDQEKNDLSLAVQSGVLPYINRKQFKEINNSLAKELTP